VKGSLALGHGWDDPFDLLQIPSHALQVVTHLLRELQEFLVVQVLHMYC
jgi:hypothetical protein